MLTARHTFQALLALALACNGIAPSFGDRLEDRIRDRMEKRSTKLALTIENIQIDESSRIPPGVIKNAKGVLILRQFEAGFVFGGKGGYGLAMQRDKGGSWGPPAWIKTSEWSGGLQIGVQNLNVVLLIMTDEGLGMLEKAKFRIGVDAAATAGPTGLSGEIKTGAEAPILMYTDTEGFYAGATLEGGFLMPDHKSNLTTYDEWLTVPDIISSSQLEIPTYAEKIIALLEDVERE